MPHEERIQVLAKEQEDLAKERQERLSRLAIPSIHMRS